jgi:hypothetical protein
MRRFEVIGKELETAKLTIAKDRTTLKLPLSMPDGERMAIEALARKIDAELPDVKFTLRGRFWNRQILLEDASNSIEPMSWSY